MLGGDGNARATRSLLLQQSRFSALLSCPPIVSQPRCTGAGKTHSAGPIRHHQRGGPHNAQGNEVVTAGAFQGFALVGTNPRLGFMGAEYYLSVIDFSLGREVNRIYGVCPSYPSAAFTSDHQNLLVPDGCGYGNN